MRSFPIFILFLLLQCFGRTVFLCNKQYLFEDMYDNSTPYSISLILNDSPITDSLTIYDRATGKELFETSISEDISFNSVDENFDSSSFTKDTVYSLPWPQVICFYDYNFDGRKDLAVFPRRNDLGAKEIYISYPDTFYYSNDFSVKLLSSYNTLQVYPDKKQYYVPDYCNGAGKWTTYEVRGDQLEIVKVEVRK